SGVLRRRAGRPRPCRVRLADRQRIAAPTMDAAVMEAREACVRRRRDTELPRRVAHREVAAHNARQPSRVHLHGRPAKALAVGPTPPEAGPYALGDEAPFELCDSRDDGEQRLAEGRACVDLLAQGDELDPEVAEQVERLDEVADAPPEAVERGYHAWVAHHLPPRVVDEETWSWSRATRTPVHRTRAPFGASPREGSQTVRSSTVRPIRSGVSS